MKRTVGTTLVVFLLGTTAHANILEDIGDALNRLDDRIENALGTADSDRDERRSASRVSDDDDDRGSDRDDDDDDDDDNDDYDDRDDGNDRDDSDDDDDDDDNDD